MALGLEAGRVQSLYALLTLGPIAVACPASMRSIQLSVCLSFGLHDLGGSPKEGILLGYPFHKADPLVLS